MSVGGQIIVSQKKRIFPIHRNNAPTLPTLEAVCNGFGITLVQFFSDRTEASALTSEQQELFSKWSTLTERQKKLLLELMETM